MSSDKLIFLDVDGVLNSTKFAVKMLEEDNVRIYAEDLLDPHALRLLKRLVDETGALLVLSSSWRKIPESRRNLERQLEQHGMRIADSTPCKGGERGDEITALFSMIPSARKCRYVILDDDSDMTVHMKHLVQTSFDTGLTREHVDKAIKILIG